MSDNNFQPIAAATAINDSDAKEYHQNWLVIDADNVWIKDEAKLKELEISLRFGYLVIKAPGMLRLDIPLDVIEDDTSVELEAVIDGRNAVVIDEGELAGAWFTQWLGVPSKLVKVHPEKSGFSWSD